MAAQPTTASEVISETAKAEGGPYKGSAAAEMQSEVGKTRNFEQAAQEVGAKMQMDPASVTSEVGVGLLLTDDHTELLQDAAYLKSREARATDVASKCNMP